MPVPELRIRGVNAAPVRASGDFVLYWMIAFRRAQHNFALDRAIELAQKFAKPLLVLEPLAASYPWASDRLHAFVVQGMADNRRAFSEAGVRYYAYVEPQRGAGRGLVEALGARAAAVVTDDFPCFGLPGLVAAAGERLNVRLEAVDSNGLLPLVVPERAFFRAFDFRRFLAKTLAEHARCLPRRSPLAKLNLPPLSKLPAELAARWPEATDDLLKGEVRGLRTLPIDHSVPPVALRGGRRAGLLSLQRFLRRGLDVYVSERNHPDAHATSGLSAYLHFGQLSAHEVFASVLSNDDLGVANFQGDRTAKDTPFAELREGPRAFLDQLVTWRELGYNFCQHHPADYAEFSTLPEWARRSLAKHAKDPREKLYSRLELADARTADPLWNAAQRELRESGVMHNYLRMLWGKRVLNWQRDPQQAYETLIELNNKYALDGRDPNSYSGIGWCFGRYDRAWGPERPVYGVIRYMTSESARRKLHLSQYLARWAESESAGR